METLSYNSVTPDVNSGLSGAQGDFILPRKLKRIHLLQEKLDNRLPIGYKES